MTDNGTTLHKHPGPPSSSNVPSTVPGADRWSEAQWLEPERQVAAPVSDDIAGPLARAFGQDGMHLVPEFAGANAPVLAGTAVALVDSLTDKNPVVQYPVQISAMTRPSSVCARSDPIDCPSGAKIRV